MNAKRGKLHRHASALFQAGRLEEALAKYRKLCRLDSNDAQAWHMAGAIAGMTGDYAAAKTCCERVIALAPGNHSPYLNLANILMATGHDQEAMQRFQQALRLSPVDPQTLTNLAGLYMKLGRSDAAEDCLRKALHSSPEYPEALNSLGNLYRETARLEDAESFLRRAVQLRPDYVDALCNLGAVLSDQLNFAGAEQCYRQALQYAPDNHAILRNLGDLCQSTGDFEQAKQCYERSLQLSASDTGTIASLARLHERRGDRDKAIALLEPLINSRHYDADTTTAYARLCSRDGRDEAGIEMLSRALETTTSENSAIDIRFALGELYDHAGQYDLAFSAFRTANDLDAARRPGQDQTAGLATMAEYFSRERLSRARNRSELPVFIVGMPRTGTSLVEQILASHPAVSAGGERGDMFPVIERLKATAAEDGRYPQCLETMAPESMDAVADAHLHTIRTLAGDCARFTDKTPLHGVHLGLISLLFPGSRVIICHRNPLDTCLSIYFHRFNAYHAYATRLEATGAFYRSYYALMRHWIETLDLKLLPIRYEELVGDPETRIRELVGFCGLEWDNRCLRFHENRRIVNTPSYNQVRKPVYTDSVDRWRHYDKYLDPLRAALEE